MKKIVNSFAYFWCVLVFIEAFEVNNFTNLCIKNDYSNKTHLSSVPEKCYQYIICRKSSYAILNCPNGMLFDSIHKICQLSEKVKCQQQNFQNNVFNDGGIKHRNCPLKDPKEPVLLPHDTDCNKFYICSGGLAYEKVCQKELHFNTELNVCDYPENANCDILSMSEIFIKKTKPQCPKTNLPMATLLPHESNCNLYYICESGKAIRKQCPNNLHFNRKEMVCDYPDRAKCKTTKEIKVITPNPEPQRRTTNKRAKETTGFPSPFCPKKNGKYPVFFRNAEDCSVYYMCGNGLAYEFTCPSKLHFNLRKRICDYPEKAGCQLGQIPDTNGTKFTDILPKYSTNMYQ